MVNAHCRVRFSTASVSRLHHLVTFLVTQSQTRSLVRPVEKPNTKGHRRLQSTTNKERSLSILLHEERVKLLSNVAPEQELARAFALSAEHFLVGEYFPKIERCLTALNDEQVWYRPNSKSNSVGNLVLHLCGNATQWIISGVGNRPDIRQRDREFEPETQVTKSELLLLLRTSISEVVSVLKNLNAESMLERRTIQGCDVDVLEAVFHVTEHFSMHTGQIIMLTKMLSDNDPGFYEFVDGKPQFRW